jgi:hypothetical protein
MLEWFKPWKMRSEYVASKDENKTNRFLLDNFVEVECCE